MRELRDARGLSQSRLAELSGVSERTVRAIERGAVERPQLESLRRIAAVLAYGESHAQRLVERWTGASTVRTPQQIGIPGWEALYQRIRGRRPEDGGRITSSVCTAWVRPDGTPLRFTYHHVHAAMSPSGPPVVWKLNGGPSFDPATMRFEVLAGGVVDEVFVHGTVSAVAVRPDPAMAQTGPFVIHYSGDFSDATRTDQSPDTEWMYGANSPLSVAALILHFVGKPPERVWSVRGDTAETAERGARLPVASDGSVQVCLQDFLGVFGIQWDHEAETG